MAQRNKLYRVSGTQLATIISSKLVLIFSGDLFKKTTYGISPAFQERVFRFTTSLEEKEQVNEKQEK